MPTPKTRKSKGAPSSSAGGDAGAGMTREEAKARLMALASGGDGGGGARSNATGGFLDRAVARGRRGNGALDEEEEDALGLFAMDDDDGEAAVKAARRMAFGEEDDEDDDDDGFGRKGLARDGGGSGSESDDYDDGFGMDGLDDGVGAMSGSEDMDDVERGGKGKKSAHERRKRGAASEEFREDGRLRMRGPIEMEGAEYAGKSAKRSDFARDEPEEASSEEEEDEEDEEEEDEEDDSDADPYADEDDDAYVGFDPESAAADDDNDEDDDDGSDASDFDADGARARDLLGAATEGDADLARELQAFRQEEEQTKKLVDSKAQHVSKGKAVRAQRTVWERALHARIRLQKAMTSAAKLPTALACCGLKRASPDVEDSMDALSRMAKKTLRTFTSLQTALMSNISDISGSTDLKSGATVVDVAGDVDDVWSRTDAAYRAFANYRDSTCDRWYRKSAVSVGNTSGGGAAGLKAFNQSISQQVSSTMRAPARLIEKSQPPKRTAPPRLGERKTASATGDDGDEDASDEDKIGVDGLQDGEAREEELFDDVDFYEQLLKEFLESGNDAGAAGAATLTKAVKRRKVVDRKASKGRKIRYHVQEPLVNFMQANDVEIPTWAERIFTQLFASHA
jgi:protein AATF/BFR2